MERAQLSFANKVPPKKKRKSRTAFTNHQVTFTHAEVDMEMDLGDKKSRLMLVLLELNPSCRYLDKRR
jgi:hypothetical protein